MFYNIASLWQSLIDYKKYDLFVASYQTLSLGILISAIYHFCGKWRNSILFLNLFGSLQFYHLTLCTLRQGLSSGFTVLLLVLMFQREEIFGNHESRDKINIEERDRTSERDNIFRTERQVKVRNRTEPISFNIYLTILTILAINAHWTGIVISIIIYATRYFQQIRIYGSRRLIFSVLIVFAMSPFIFSIIENRLDLYLQEASTGYGEKIFLTSISDLILVLIVLWKSINKLLKPDISVESICYTALIVISLLIIFFKIITLTGFGVALRIILGLTTLQLICLPVLLNDLNILFRVLVIALISTPYLVFIFQSSPERFMPVQSILF